MLTRRALPFKRRASGRASRLGDRPVPGPYSSLCSPADLPLGGVSSVFIREAVGILYSQNIANE